MSTSTSTSQFQNSFLFNGPLLVEYALAQQDGEGSPEPNDLDESDNQQVEDDNGSETPGVTGGSTSENVGPSSSGGCPVDFALDPTTGECDSTLGPCPEGETRGESGFCAVMPETCSPGTYINEDPLCEPCPTEGDIPSECTAPQLQAEQGPETEAEPEPEDGTGIETEPLPGITNTTNPGNTTIPGNTTTITINNAIAQAFSNTIYNTNVLQQLAANTLLVGEETVPLQGLIKANDSRLLSTFEPFRLLGGSAVVYLPTSNISTPTSSAGSSFVVNSNSLQLVALDGDSQQYVTLPSVKMPVVENSYKSVLGEAFKGTNPYTGEQVTVDNIKALYLLNESNQTITFGYGSSVALLTIVG